MPSETMTKTVKNYSITEIVCDGTGVVNMLVYNNTDIPVDVITIDGEITQDAINSSEIQATGYNFDKSDEMAS